MRSRITPIAMAAAVAIGVALSVGPAAQPAVADTCAAPTVKIENAGEVMEGYGLLVFNWPERFRWGVPGRIEPRRAGSGAGVGHVRDL